MTEAVENEDPVTLSQRLHGDMQLSLEANKPRWLLGENIVLHYVVKNVGDARIKISFGGDYRGGARAARIKVLAAGLDGSKVADPYPGDMNFGGMGGEHALEPGDEFAFTVPLTRYCRFEKPGRYKIAVAHDLGRGDQGKTIPATDARWVDGEIEIAAPTATQARNVVLSMQSLSSDTNKSVGERVGAFADFSAMGYPIYLPMLASMVKEEPRAFYGLGNIATVEATRTLIELGAHDVPEVSNRALEVLAARLPDPGARHNFRAEERAYFVRNAWNPEELAPALRKLAMQLIDDSDPERVTFGARLLAPAVEAKDIALVTRALDRSLEATKTKPIPYPEPRTPVSQLLRTASTLLERGAAPVADPKTPGEIGVYLLKNGTASPRPPAYAGLATQWLDHPIPQVRVLALRQTAPPLDAGMQSKLGPLLHFDHLGVQNAACDAVAQLGHGSGLQKDVLKQMRTAEDQWLVRCLNRTAAKLGVPRDQIVDIWVARLDEVDRTMLMFNQLLIVVDSGSHGMSGKPDAAEAKRLKTAWERWAKKHRGEVRKGKIYTPGDRRFPVELLPKGFNFTLADGKTWPPR